MKAMMINMGRYMKKKKLEVNSEKTKLRMSGKKVQMCKIKLIWQGKRDRGGKRIQILGYTFILKGVT